MLPKPLNLWTCPVLGVWSACAVGAAADRVAMHVDSTWRDVDGPALVIRLTPEPGWHLYWSNPGDSGQPPRIDVKLPPTWSQGESRFATPSVISEGASTAFGYAEPCTIIVPIFPNRMGIEPVPQPPSLVTVDASWLVCKEQCEKGSTHATVTMDVGDPQPLPEAVARQFPMPMPAASRIAVAGDRAGTDPFEGSLELSIPDVPAGARLLLDLPDAISLPSPSPIPANAAGTPAASRVAPGDSTSAPTFSVTVTVRPEDVEGDALRIRGVILRPADSALLVDFSVPREALANNPSIGLPTPTRLTQPAPEPTQSKETFP